MYRKIIFSLALSIVVKTASSQSIKINNGILFSSFNNSKDLPVLRDKAASYSVSVGADYLENRWFYLSTEVGYMKIGGKENNPFLSEEYAHISEKKSYIHVNTTFRAYKEISDVKIFIGAGPFINVLTGSKKFDTALYRDFYDLTTYGGAKGEIGVTYDFSRFRLGLVGGYMISMTDAGSSSDMTLGNNSFEGKLSIGYLLHHNKR